MSSLPRLTFYCLSLVVLSACAVKGNTSLAEPTDGARARVRGMVFSVFNNYRGLHALPDSTCVDAEVKGNGTLVNSQFGFGKSLNGQSLGMPATASSLDKEINKTEAYVAGNQPITFSYFIPAGSGSAFGCDAAISFTPEAGADYEVLFQKDTCQGTVNKLVVAVQGGAPATTLVPVSFKNAERCVSR